MISIAHRIQALQSQQPQQSSPRHISRTSSQAPPVPFHRHDASTLMHDLEAHDFYHNHNNTIASSTRFYADCDLTTSLPVRRKLGTGCMMAVLSASMHKPCRCDCSQLAIHRSICNAMHCMILRLKSICLSCFDTDGTAGNSCMMCTIMAITRHLLRRRLRVMLQTHHILWASDVQDLANTEADKAGLCISSDVDFGSHQMVFPPATDPRHGRLGYNAEPLYAFVERVQRRQERLSSSKGK